MNQENRTQWIFSDIKFWPGLALSACLGSLAASLFGHQAATAAEWQLTYGQSPAEYQSTQQALTGQGFRPVSLDIDGVGAGARYAVIWRNDGFTNWLSELELTYPQFTNRIATLAALGYRVLCLDSHGNYPNEQYAAVWVQDEMARNSTTDVRDLDGASISPRCYNEGYYPSWIDVQPSPVRRFATVYCKGASYFAYMRGVTEAELRNQWIPMFQAWGWPSVLRSYSGLFAAIWAGREVLDGEDFRLELNQTSVELGHTLASYREDGFEPISLTQSTVGSSSVYCSVWKRPPGRLQPNKLTLVAPLAGGQAQLRFEGEVPTDLSRYYEVLPLHSSADLVSWESMATLIKTNAQEAPATWTDNEAAQFPRRFYRTQSERLITPLLRPTGPYAIGEFSALLTDPARTNSNRKTNMQFMVTCWYPSPMQEGNLPAPFVDKAVTHVSSAHLPWSRLAGMVAHSSLGLPLSSKLARYPVVLFSPSFHSHRRETLMLVEELASHGFVVVGMDHRETLMAQYPDGTWVAGEIVGPTEQDLKARDLERVDDARLVIAALEQWQTAHPSLAGHLDLERIGAFGFSLGGSTAANLAENHPRLKASIDIDGTLWDDALIAAGPSKPFMLLCSDFGYFMEDPSVLFLTRAKAPGYYVALAGTLHQSYSDSGLLLDLLAFNQLHGSESQRASVEGVQVQAIARSVVLSFFKRHLNGEEDGVLDNVMTNSPATASSVLFKGGPVITKALKNTAVTVGQTLNLSVTATNQEPLAYQWFSNGALIPGATDAALTVSPVSLATAGQYTVRVTGQNGTVMCSCPVKVMPLRFTTQPQNVKASYGGSATFRATVQSPEPVIYQWLHNGQEMPGATAATLALTNIQPEAMGSYTVRASNVYGNVNSTNAQLDLRPFLLEFPENQILRVGDRLNLTARGVGSLPMRYQWRRDNISQCRLTRHDLTSSFAVPSVQLTDAGLYTLTITNAAGTATSLQARASVLVVQPPTDQEGLPGSTATFSASVAKGIATAPGLQWQFGGVNIEGANTGTLVLTNIQPADAGVYTLLVTNNIDRSASFSAVLKVSGN
jgi:predicted dienelactone hydrolase